MASSSFYSLQLDESQPTQQVVSVTDCNRDIVNSEVFLIHPNKQTLNNCSNDKILCKVSIKSQFYFFFYYCVLKISSV